MIYQKTPVQLIQEEEIMEKHMKSQREEQIELHSGGRKGKLASENEVAPPPEVKAKTNVRPVNYQPDAVVIDQTEEE